MTRKLKAVPRWAAVIVALAVTAGLGLIVATQASATGDYITQGSTINECINLSTGHSWYEVHTDTLGNCPPGNEQLTVVADPGGYAIPAPGTGTGTDVVTVTNPGTQNSNPGAVISLQLTAVSSQAHPISSWSSTTLPAGLSINSSGLISGTLAGSDDGQTFTVTVNATDSVATVGSATFDWVVNS
jgi:Putative Ig domain